MKILVKPIVTEKMTMLTEKQHKYGFVVNKSANKIQIKSAVEKAYNVTVKSVNTLVVPGKLKQRFTKKGINTGVKSSYKKAIVTLAATDTIDFYGSI